MRKLTKLLFMQKKKKKKKLLSTQQFRINWRSMDGQTIEIIAINQFKHPNRHRTVYYKRADRHTHTHTH